MTIFASKDIVKSGVDFAGSIPLFLKDEDI